ncbi:MAG: glycosyltransferase [Rhizobiales bacterium]|nr:glycosyltransferase [Hyphomicrobiales bacterium]
MDSLALICAVAALSLLFLHLLSAALAGRALRPQPRSCETPPPICVIRPLCGLDADLSETIETTFALEGDREIIFCVARDDDPAAALARAAIARHRDADARLLVGAERLTSNAKLDNCMKGWRAATAEWIVLSDCNVLLPPDYLARLWAARGPGVGLVSAPPIGVRPAGFAAEIEAATLNLFQARLQYTVDALGFGFAQGKTLFCARADLERAGGYGALAQEPAEDAAFTKAMRRAGMRVRLAGPGFGQPLGRRAWRDVWGRQLRWARLRRASFPAIYAFEILAGSLPPAALATAAALAWGATDAESVAAALATLAAWHAIEAAMARAIGWRYDARTLAAALARDAALPALFVAGLAGRDFDWRGETASAVAQGRRGRRIRRKMTIKRLDCDRANDQHARATGL